MTGSSLRGNILCIVVPCYNEEEVLKETAKRLIEKLNELIKGQVISENSRIAFVDDGSTDGTWDLIERFNKENELIMGIKLSRNCGHQNALLAGIMSVKNIADMVISIDADLQDDVNKISDFIKEYNNGCEIVYGVRSDRKKDTFFKRATAQTFYKLLRVMGVEIIYNHADYRLLSKRAISELENFKEVNLFLRGIVPLIGFKCGKVYYERNKRFAGESKYPLKKMLNFAFDGITSFSVKPIRLVTFVGFLIFTISIIFSIYFLFAHFKGYTVQGWTTIVLSVWGIGGLELLAIGIIGEYIGKIYMESKARPKYIIDRIID